MSLSNESTMVMPVAPAYQGGYNNGGCGSMWGGDWASWIILFLIFGMFGGNGWGAFGGFGGRNGAGCCQPATCADVQRGFDNQSVMNKLNGIEQGISQAGYAALQQTNTLENGLCQLGYQTQAAITGVGTQLQQYCCDTQRAIDGVNYNTLQNFSNLNSKFDSCCCETQRQIERGFCDTNYALATNTTAIIQNAHNDTDRVIAKLCDMENSRKDEKIASQQAEIQGLKFAASQASQNAFITANQEAQTAELIRRLGRDCPVPAYVVPNPNCCYGNPVGVMSNGCGCNNGCGC